MNTYRVGITYIVYVEVEADNELEAVDSAVQVIDTPMVTSDQAYIVLDEYTDPSIEIVEV